MIEKCVQNHEAFGTNKSMAHRCSILVVTLNEAHHLPQLKAALDRLRRPPDTELETILVDGGSSDNTPQIARDSGFDRVMVLPGASIPACRNRGLSEASGDWVAFLDGDCEPDVDWLVNAAMYLDRETPTLVGWPVEPPSPGTWIQRAWHAHWMNKNRAAISAQPVRSEAFRLITTRNMLLNRKVLEYVNRFDEQLLTGEDTDFVFRAHRQGVEVIAVPSLRVVHRGEPATLSEFFRQQLWHANRLSYRRIVKETGGRVGGNVIYFTVAYCLTGLVAVVGLLLAVLRGHAAWGLLTLFWILLLAAPAFLVAARARQPKIFGPLIILYAVYGFARSLDLLGVHRIKRNWKSTKQLASCS